MDIYKMKCESAKKISNGTKKESEEERVEESRPDFTPASQVSVENAKEEDEVDAEKDGDS